MTMLKGDVTNVYLGNAEQIEIIDETIDRCFDRINRIIARSIKVNIAIIEDSFGAMHDALTKRGVEYDQATGIVSKHSNHMRQVSDKRADRKRNRISKEIKRLQKERDILHQEMLMVIAYM